MHSPVSCSVRAPASSANLGPGFDSLAVALDLWLRVDLTHVDTPGIRDGGSPDLLGGGNLVIKAMHVTAERLGVTLPGCEITVASDIPVARGLGSSAAAIVAGIFAAAELAGCPMTSALAIDIGGQMEGHADNVSAAVLGGATISIQTADGYIAEQIASELPWTPIVFIPNNHSLTLEARGILPSAIPISDAAANIGRGALLAWAIQNARADLLREAMRDRLHQPYRARIFSHLEPVIDGALAAGAHGACLSGAGPTLLAFADPTAATAVAEAMQSAARAVGVTGLARALSVATSGCHVE